MKLDVQNEGDVVILRPAGQLDALSAPKLEEALAPVMAGEPKRVILDLTDAPYVSSAGLRVLIQLAKQMMKFGRLAVTGLNGPVREVFQLAGFDKIMTLCADLDSARQQV